MNINAIEKSVDRHNRPYVDHVVSFMGPSLWQRFSQILLVLVFLSGCNSQKSTTMSLDCANFEPSTSIDDTDKLIWEYLRLDANVTAYFSLQDPYAEGNANIHFTSPSYAAEEKRRCLLASLSKSFSLESETNTSQASIIVHAITKPLKKGLLPDYGSYNPLWFTGYSPYALTHISGPYVDGMARLNKLADIKTVQDIDLLKQAIENLSVILQQLQQRLEQDKMRGIILPEPIRKRLLDSMNVLLQKNIKSWPFYDDFISALSKKPFNPDIKNVSRQKILLSISSRLRPAVSDLANILQDNGKDENQIPVGIWYLPGGAEAYTANLLLVGDSDMTAQEIHDLGLKEVARISDDLENALSSIGSKEGSLRNRVMKLMADPRQLFENTDEGRQQAMAYLQHEIRLMNERIKTVFWPKDLPKVGVTVKRPPAILEGAGRGGFYDPPPSDFSGPGTFWVNLKDMTNNPKFRLPSMTFHESVPGHHIQGAFPRAENEDILSRIMQFNAFNEGWALYAEKLAYELGAYQDNPEGNIGRLSDELLRAVRLVVDTGIHHKKWTRQQSIDYMWTNLPVPDVEIEFAVDRYIAWPGQALGYKLGELKILELRQFAQKNLGEDFDIRDFHHVILSRVSAPISVIEKDVIEWVSSFKGFEGKEDIK